MRTIAMAMLLTLASCGGGEGKPAAGTPLPPSPLPPSALPPAPSAESPPRDSAQGTGGRLGISFDPAALTKGTKVGTLEADMLVLSRAPDSSWVGQARFTGALTVTGRAIPHVDANVRHVCFEPDSASATTLPRWAGDMRRPWFCFSNQPEAQQSLAALYEERPATVVIDQYTINKGRADEENTARLDRVVQRGEPIPRP